MTNLAQSQLLQGTYFRGEARRLVSSVLALVAMVLLSVVDMAIGPSGMSLSEVWTALLAGPQGEDRMAGTILWQIRMPQTAMAIIVGACLGLAGLQMQTILDNPLASPFTLGFSASAGFGASFAIMFGSALPVPEFIVIPISAFAMTLTACGIVYAIVIYRGASPEILVLSGIAVLFFFQSLQSLMQFMASPEVLQQIVFWLFGSLLKANWTSVMTSGMILALCIPLVAKDAWKLTTLRLGDANARSLGLAVDGLRRRSFVLVALLTAAAVSFVGTIGFVGLIAPHVARSLVGEDHRYALPSSAIVGALILLLASICGKLISPEAVIPVGIITAIAGIPMLLAVILQHRDGVKA